MPETKAEKAAKAAAKAPEPPKEKAASSQPREYVVFRELTLNDLITRGPELGLDGATPVLVELGTTDAKTPKEARRTVAKAKLDEAELKGDGVPLRAITKSGATAGRGVARLKVEPTWDD